MLYFVAWNVRSSRSHEEPMDLIVRSYPHSCSYWLGSKLEFYLFVVLYFGGLKPWVTEKPQITIILKFSKHEDKFALMNIKLHVSLLLKDYTWYVLFFLIKTILDFYILNRNLLLFSRLQKPCVRPTIVWICFARLSAWWFGWQRGWPLTARGRRRRGRRKVLETLKPSNK